MPTLMYEKWGSTGWILLLVLLVVLLGICFILDKKSGRK